VSAAEYIGKPLSDAGVTKVDLEAIVETGVRSGEPRERAVAHGLVISMFPDGKEAWAEALIAKGREQGWGNTALLTILQALPLNRWTWDQAAQVGEEFEASYWLRAPAFWIDDAQEAAFAVRKLISVGRARHALHLVGRHRRIGLPSELLVEVLTEAARQPFKSGGNTNEPTMFQHYVAEILSQLDSRSDVDSDALVMLEWNYLPVLEHSRRPAKVLLKALSENPALFVEMVSAVFNPSEESGVVDSIQTDPERARAIAHQAYRLLKLWTRIPGTQEDGTIDGEVLEAWVKDARALAKAAGREDVSDSQIGKMLSASPLGSDSVWPAEAVRDVLDLFRSKPLLESFWIGKSNQRGDTTRMPRDGGGLERKEAAQYRRWAAALVYDHPYTAKAVDALAESYEHEAHREDEAAERLDWEP
jgi:hypothetical protein